MTFTSPALNLVSPTTMSVILATSDAFKALFLALTTTLTLLSPIKATQSV